MNVRKHVDYSDMFITLAALVAARLPQMKLYYEIGRLVSDRPEKGAAVMAAEYLHDAYPDTSGFSPRNLRRMREFYRTYEAAPEVLAKAMTIGWTQNVVILEAELTLPEKTWYIRAVQQFSWSKLTLLEKIKSGVHTEVSLDFQNEVCHSRKNSPPDKKHRLRPFRPFNWDKQGQSAEYVPNTWRRLRRQDTPANGICGPPRSQGS